MYFIPFLFLAAILVLIVFNYRNLMLKERSAGALYESLSNILKKKYKLVDQKESLIRAHTSINDSTWRKIDEIATEGLQNENINAIENSSLKSKFVELFAPHEKEIKTHVEAHGEDKALREFALTWEDYQRQIDEHSKAYNSAVASFNNSILYFPSSLVARVAGFRPINEFGG